MPAKLKRAQDLFYGPVERLAAGDGKGRVGLRGKDVELRHGLGGAGELGANASLGATALAGVAVNASSKADLGGCIDVDGKIVKRKKVGVVQGENTFHDENGPRRKHLKAIRDTRMRFEVINRALDGVAVREIADVLQEEFAFERVGVIEVPLMAAIERKLGQVAVVKIEGKQGSVELMREFPGERALAGAGATGDAENKGGTGAWERFGLAHPLSVSGLLCSKSSGVSERAE